MFIVYDENMKRIEFPQGITPLDIFISSIEKERITGRTERSIRKTTRKYIELDTGWNDFEIKGATSAQVEFDFKFYYL